MPDGIEVVGQDDPFSNVIDFRTGEQYEPPEPTPRERIRAKKPDQEAVRHLKELLKDFKKGKLHGLVMVAGVFDDAGNLVNYETVISQTAGSYPISFLGAIEQTKLLVSDLGMGMADEGEHPHDDEPEVILLSPDD